MNPQQQHAAGVLASMGAAFLLFSLLLTAFLIFLLWRIFVKAGLAGPLSLLAIIPGVGPLIVLCVLAFSRWRVVPVAEGYEPGAGYPAQPYPASYSTAVSSTTYPPPAYPPMEQSGAPHQTPPPRD